MPESIQISLNQLGVKVLSGYDNYSMLFYHLDDVYCYGQSYFGYERFGSGYVNMFSKMTHAGETNKSGVKKLIVDIAYNGSEYASRQEQ